MGCNSYIFLNRRFDKDQSRLDKMLNYYSQCGYNYQILLYPEGTDKCPLATERSRKYAEKNNLVHYQYVLHPRTTGFVYIVQSMRKAGYIDYIYDVTIGFGDCIVQSEVDFAVYGVCPKDVHYQVRKLKISDLPADDKGLAEWLINLWKEKEEKLRTFYSKDPSIREFDNTPEGKDYEISKNIYVTQMCIISFWTLTTLIWAYGFLM
ncbi:Lysocardiolipin acyltransferase 1, partial [Trichostrongylus colubriformis]